MEKGIYIEKTLAGSYKKKDLKIIADSILANKNVTKAHVFFNNTATHAAIKNANSLKKYICED